MFVTPDSIVPDLFDPQTLNRYSYCRNNPLIYTDPSGHKITGPFDKREYTFTGYVDQPGIGGDDDINEGTDVGHAFAGLTEQTAGNTETKGKHIKGDGIVNTLRSLDAVRSKDVPGVIKDNTGHVWDVKIERTITEAQYEKIMEIIRRDEKKVDKYNLRKASCVPWMSKIAKIAGIDLPPDINNPGELGEWLMNHGGTRNERGIHPGIGPRSNDLDHISGL